MCETFQHVRISVEQHAVVSPSGNDAFDSCLLNCDPVIVLGADGVLDFGQPLRVSRPVSKEIDQYEPSIPPAVGEPDAAPHGRIITLIIRR